MSKRAMQWVDTVKIGNAPMYQVLRMLAYWHNDSAHLFPSQPRIAEATGLSERAVRYALQRLSHFGVIKRTPRSAGNKGKTSDLFELSFGLHDISREQVAAAIKALRKASSNRHHVPVADLIPQPAPGASPPGTACRGIGELIEEPSQGVTGLGIGQYAREAAGDRPGLRLVSGG